MREVPMPPNILGIDIGSVSIAIAEVSFRRQVLQTDYVIHGGDITRKLHRSLDKFDLRNIGWIAATSSTPTTASRMRA